MHYRQPPSCDHCWFFLSGSFVFHEESLSLAEKTRFASPQRRMAANRCNPRADWGNQERNSRLKVVNLAFYKQNLIMAKQIATF
jgi:hypothetical protein